MTDDAQLFGEEWITAVLLAMVIEHCAAYSPEARRRMTSFLSNDPSPEQWLDSYNITANAEAMRELEGLIEITEQDGAHIVAKLTPEGRAMLDQLRAEQERNRARGDAMTGDEQGPGDGPNQYLVSERPK